MENLNDFVLYGVLIYVTLTLAVSIYGAVNKIGFSISFVWSLCFTPIIGYILVSRNIMRKRDGLPQFLTSKNIRSKKKDYLD